MRFSHFLYGVLATVVFIILMAVFTNLLGSLDFTYIAICILFGTIITCTIYISDAIKDLKNDLNKINHSK